MGDDGGEGLGTVWAGFGELSEGHADVEGDGVDDFASADAEGAAVGEVGAGAGFDGFAGELAAVAGDAEAAFGERRPAGAAAAGGEGGEREVEGEDVVAGLGHVAVAKQLDAREAGPEGSRERGFEGAVDFVEAQLAAAFGFDALRARDARREFEPERACVLYRRFGWGWERRGAHERAMRLRTTGNSQANSE